MYTKLDSLEKSDMLVGSCLNCYLDHTSFLKNCVAGNGEELFSKKELRKFKRGEFLLKEGRPVTGLFCIQSGVIKISKEIKGKKEFILWFAKPGEIIGVDSFINNPVNSFSAEATESVTTCFIPGSELIELMRTKPDLSFQVMKYLCDKTEYIEKRITSIAQKKTKAQFAEILLTLLNEDEREGMKNKINYTIKDIANTIGTTRNYLYKILSEFSKEKIVLVENRKLKIINQDKLSKIAIGE